MCGRFTQHYSWQQVHEFLSVIGALQNLQPRADTVGVALTCGFTGCERWLIGAG